MFTVQAPISPLRTLFRTYRGKLLITYFALQVEHAVRMVQPFVLGIAVNDLLANSYDGLWLFVIQHVIYMSTSIFRQVYDTRVFTSIYCALASGVVENQRKADVEVTRVAARTALSQEFVDFLATDVPLAIQSFYSIAGSVFMLWFYDSVLVWFCSALMLPASLIYLRSIRMTTELTAKLNDEIEQEVAVIAENDTPKVVDHFKAIAYFRVKLSNIAASNFGSMEFFVLIVMTLALLRFSQLPDVTTGSILATFTYVVLFVSGLDAVPILVLQATRLKDINRRLTLEVVA